MTAQVHEQLIYNGEHISMACTPELPEKHPRIAEATEEEQESDPENRFIGSTMCWRRYLGLWEIKDERLYLKDLRGKYKLLGDELLFADWFTGTLRIPRGERLEYVHMGFDSVYEKDVIIDVEKGVVMATAVIDNRDI